VDEAKKTHRGKDSRPLGEGRGERANLEGGEKRRNLNVGKRSSEENLALPGESGGLRG